jgi:hypothetical protein
MMEKKQSHLVEVDLETQTWIEQYSERKGLSIQETLERLLRAGRSMLERQELEIANLSKGDIELPPRVKIGVQASVECLSILRKVHLPDLAEQKKLASEVKALIEKTLQQMAEIREEGLA